MIEVSDGADVLFDTVVLITSIAIHLLVICFSYWQANKVTELMVSLICIRSFFAIIRPVESFPAVHVPQTAHITNLTGCS